ncbi:hypothetical protein, partial [Microbispora rosea]
LILPDRLFRVKSAPPGLLDPKPADRQEFRPPRFRGNPSNLPEPPPRRKTTENQKIEKYEKLTGNRRAHTRQPPK